MRVKCRPCRYYVTKDDLVILASEAGVLDVPPEDVVRKGRLQPGRMFLVDTAQGRIVEDEEIKRAIFASVGPHLSATAILASNTSSIPITRMAAGTADPTRFVGLHFFNPVPRMKLLGWTGLAIAAGAAATALVASESPYWLVAAIVVVCVLIKIVSFQSDTFVFQE